MVPNSPEKVEIIDDSPTSVTLRVTPPKENGGMPVLAYRVDFDHEPKLLDTKTEEGESR